MKRLRSSYLIPVLMLLLVILSTPYISLIPRAVADYENPTIHVEPSFVYGYQPGETFNLEILIGYDYDPTTWVLDLYLWDIELSFKKSLETLRVLDIIEGTFLSSGGQPTVFYSNLDQQTSGWVKASGSRVGDISGADGYGLLATLQCKVVGGGSSQLDLTATILKDSDQLDITHSVVNSYFLGMAPYAFFTYWPNATVPGGYNPAVNQTVTFDATLTQDEDSGNMITLYEWDFDDGTPLQATTDPIITHNFTEQGERRVNLTVTDDVGFKDSYDVAVTIVIRDIAIIGMDLFPTGQVKAGIPIAINVTVMNLGTLRDEYNVTAYANDSPVGNATLRSLDGDRNETITIDWDTTGLPTDLYLIKANVTLVYPEQGENNLTNNEFIFGTVAIAEVSKLVYPVTVFGARFYIGVETISESISGFAFDHSLKQVSSDVGGQVDTTSYSNVTIPMILLNASDPNSWSVKLNDTTTAYTPTSNGTHYFIYFDYTFASTYQAKVIGTWVNSPPQPVFTASTAKAQLGDSVAFNATGSHDPDPNGKIVRYFIEFDDASNATGTPNYDPITKVLLNYTWVFKKGATTTTFNTTELVIDHAYELERYGVAGAFNVRLTVTDKDGLRNSTVARVEIFGKYDLAITNVSLNATTINSGQALSVTTTIACRHVPAAGISADLILLGNGTVLTQKAVQIAFASAGGSRIVELIWDTTGIDIGVYELSVTITVTKIGTLSVSDYPFPEEETAENTMASEDVLLKKWDSHITITVSPSTFTVGSFTKISGILSTPQGPVGGVEVTVQSRIGTAAWTALTTQTTNVQGMYLYTWTPATAATYQVRAIWLGDSATSQNETAVQTVTVRQQTSEITLDVSATSVTTGSSVVISGQITPGTADVTVTIRVRKNGGEWTSAGTAVTDAQGSYSFEWTPADAGTYEIQASWEGTVNVSGKESDSKTVTVTTGGIPEIYIYAAVGVIIVVAVIVAFFFLRRRK